jgi:hypothetical protein
MFLKNRKTTSLLILFLLFVSFDNVWAQSRKFFKKQPDFNVPLQQPEQPQDNRLPLAHGAIDALLMDTKLCFEAIDKLVNSSETTLDGIRTQLLFQHDGVGNARRLLESYFGPGSEPDLLAMYEEARSPISSERARRITSLQERMYLEMGGRLREMQVNIEAIDENLNQEILQLTGQALANQFIEDSQGSCGLTLDNNPWIGGQQR